MHPIAFEVFGRPIHWYGIMAALGYLGVMLYWSQMAKRDHVRPGFSSLLASWLLIGGILGARIAYILANIGYFLTNPLEMIRIDQGGLVFYGGFIGAIIAFLILSHRKHFARWPLGDLILSGLPLGHAMGRIGCFLNGCCYGKACSIPWAVTMHQMARHPVQLYEAAFNFALFALLVTLYLHKKRDGIIYVAYCLIYPVLRFSLEYLRGDERITYLGLTLAQVTSLTLFIAGIVFLFVIPKTRQPIASPEERSTS